VFFFFCLGLGLSMPGIGSRAVGSEALGMRSAMQLQMYTGERARDSSMMLMRWIRIARDGGWGTLRLGRGSSGTLRLNAFVTLPSQIGPGRTDPKRTHLAQPHSKFT
jgi:hypothetical protein